MTWAHFAFYCAALTLAGIWTFCLIQDVRQKPRKPAARRSCAAHHWAMVTDYGHMRKCRCRRCGEVALVRVIIPRP